PWPPPPKACPMPCRRRSGPCSVRTRDSPPPRWPKVSESPGSPLAATSNPWPMPACSNVAPATAPPVAPSPYTTSPPTGPEPARLLPDGPSRLTPSTPESVHTHGRAGRDRAWQTSRNGHGGRLGAGWTHVEEVAGVVVRLARPRPAHRRRRLRRLPTPDAQVHRRRGGRTRSRRGAAVLRYLA